MRVPAITFLVFYAFLMMGNFNHGSDRRNFEDSSKDGIQLPDVKYFEEADYLDYKKSNVSKGKCVKTSTNVSIIAGFLHFSLKNNVYFVNKDWKSRTLR